MAVVGVLGTLVSGLLAHRSALRATTVELAHQERQWQQERRAQDRREELAARRAAYTALNQAMRHFHAVLYRDHQAYAARGADPEAHDRDAAHERREADRRALRDAYAEAQMIVPDAVLETAGRLVHHLSRTHALLGEGGAPAEEIGERLARASERLYEVRQTMRRDLGISVLPTARPEGYGAS